MFDGHIHFSRDLQAERLASVMELNHYDDAALLCIAKGTERHTEYDALEFRDHCRRKGCRTKIHVFGGVDHSVYTLSKADMSKALVNRLDELMAGDFAGVKFVEGKPNIRKAYHVPPFDSDVWEPFWKKAEEEFFPVIMHVNDPETFWGVDPEASPEEIAFRKSCGWLYNETFINNEAQYAEILNVLERHPRLNILFPHFFFLSKQLSRFSEIFERFPNVMTDLTPGVELFINLSENAAEASRFLNRWQDRICYGTDIGSRQVVEPAPAPLNLEETKARVDLVQGFLTAKEDHLLEPNAYYHGSQARVLRPMHLDDGALEKIFDKNFRRFMER